MDEKEIIAIAGKKAAGKDLLGKKLIIRGFKRFAFGDLIRDGVKRDFGLTDEQVNGKLKEAIDSRWGITPRDIMERYGMFFRSIDPKYWIKKLGWEITKSGADKVVVTDVRLKAEVDFLKSLGAKIVRLERDPELRRKVYPDVDSTAPTEIELDGYDGFDVVLPAEKNKVPEDLEVFVKEII